jgi:methionine-rich copper-binding protein CopC
MGKPQATDDPKSFKAEVLEQIEAGSYQVIWRAAGSDGHAIRGRYGFEVRSVAGSEQ